MRKLNLVNKAIEPFGMQLRRNRPSENQFMRLKMLLDYFGIETVFDIGANEGLFAEDLREAGYAGTIISFEPLSGAHNKLSRRSSRDEKWIAAERMALGDENGEITLNVSANSVSSSVLQILDRHTSADPNSRIVEKELVPIHRFDDVVAQIGDFDMTTSFLKLDVQGYEEVVLRGAAESMKSIRGLQLELSTVQLYEGHRLFWELTEEYRSRGFDIFSMTPGFTDPESGRVLQYDGVFFRD